MVPQFLVAGHVCRDLQDDGYRLGGTAAYASLTVQRLGLRAAALTCSCCSVDLASLLPGVQVLNIPSTVTTTFENRYRGGKRQQYLHAVAPAIGVDALPAKWRACPVVLLGPVAQEVDPLLAQAFPKSLVGVSPQGWMRCWDHQGRISPTGWDGEELKGTVEVVVLGEEDLPSGKLAHEWLDWAPVLVVTEGMEGARMRWQGTWYKIPAYPAREVDPTGAGDVFAAAYLVRYHETGDPFASALFASCAACFSVESPGLEGIPSRPQVEQRLRQYPERAWKPL